MGFEFASRASKGARNYQEDAVALWAEPGEGPATFGPDGKALRLTAVLADGMGGHVGGARASELACMQFLHAFGESAGDVPGRLQGALDSANAAIHEEAIGNPTLNGMGCTLVGAVFSAQGIEWVSVGDSPLFLIRDNEIVVLNEDHSLAPEIDRLAEAGKITWEDAHADPRRHFLRSALTGEEIELVDRSVRPLALRKDDIVILASDGIHTLSLQDIFAGARERIVQGPAAVAEALLATVAARKQMHQDNTTVIVVLTN